MSRGRNGSPLPAQSKGAISVDDGAGKAIIERGKVSSAGILNTSGSFKAGDKVEVRSKDGRLIAGGLVNYSSDEIKAIQGCKSSEIASRLGKKNFDEVIHRDNLVLMGSSDN